VTQYKKVTIQNKNPETFNSVLLEDIDKDVKPCKNIRTDQCHKIPQGIASKTFSSHLCLFKFAKYLHSKMIIHYMGPHSQKISLLHHKNSKSNIG